MIQETVQQALSESQGTEALWWHRWFLWVTVIEQAGVIAMLCAFRPVFRSRFAWAMIATAYSFMLIDRIAILFGQTWAMLPSRNVVLPVVISGTLLLGMAWHYVTQSLPEAFDIRTSTKRQEREQ